LKQIQKEELEEAKEESKEVEEDFLIQPDFFIREFDNEDNETMKTSTSTTQLKEKQSILIIPQS
jgi:hypothetical protein